MCPAIFISTLREGHLPFQERLKQQAAHETMPSRPTSAARLPHTAYSAGALIARRREIRMPKHASLFA
jgi:hypothetical protein